MVTNPVPDPSDPPGPGSTAATHPATDVASTPTSTLGLQGLAWLLAAQALGEVFTRSVALPLPGPVVGMVLLLVVLRWPSVRSAVGVCANFLLAHLSLLFVPVGVGVMTHLGLVGQYGGRMLGVLVLSTALGLAVTALVLHWMRDTTDHG
jgi:holin-like protein